MGLGQVGCNALKADCDVAAHLEGGASGRWGRSVRIQRYWQGDRWDKSFSGAFLLKTTILRALLCACVVARLSFYLPPVPSFPTPVFYFRLHTQIMQTMMYAQLVLTETSRKRVVYTSPVDILIWLAFPFSKTWNFNCAGVIEVRLSMFDHGGKTARNMLRGDWLTDILNGCDTYNIKPRQISWPLPTRATDPHLLTPFLRKNSASPVMLKRSSTL